MERYIAVDSGKFATKIAWANDDFKGYQKGQFRTRMSHGNFEDDAIENGTYVCEIDGVVMKIGNGAAQDASLETTKKSEIHKYCTLLAIALVVSPDAIDDVHCAIGSPSSEYKVVEKRNEYRDYILPEGQVTVKYKMQKGGIETRTFNIVKKYVYTESAGGIYLDIKRNMDTAAVIDIGNLNVNATYFANKEPDFSCSMTSELGGQILISGLAAELSSAFTRCDERVVGRLLKGPLEDRYLHPVSPNPQIEEESRLLISDYLMDHIKKIRRTCDSKGWALDYMPVTFIGGTSALLTNEIHAVFGDEAFIPEKPEIANALGFLRRMVAWEKEILIPIESAVVSNNLAV